jgi:hypothetical protein
LKQRRSLWALSYVLIVGTSIFFAFSHWVYDDPFIAYRYAFNLSHGNGLVYNIGERSMSMTSPFFVLLLTTVSPLWNDFPHLANLIGAFSIATGGIFLWFLATTWKSPITSLVVLFLFPTFPLLISTLGSETPLYIAFCLAAFAFYARKEYTLSAVMASLATLTRPDGALVLLLLAVGYINEVRSPIRWGVVLIILVIILPWFLFAWYYYGSPIPLTLFAKQHQGSMAISQRFAPGFATIIGGYADNLSYQLEAVLAVLGLISLLVFSQQWMLFIFWQILYLVSYSILGVSRYFWYYTPLVPGFITLVGLGFATIQRQIVSIIEKVKHQSLSQIRLLSIITIIMVALFCFSHVITLQELREAPDERYPIYREAGEWLRANTPEDASVGTLEVGIIGYYSERFMVDFAGLLQPDIASQLTSTTTYDDAACWAVIHYRPNYLVILEGTLPALENSYVVQHCKAVHRIPGEIRGREVKLDIYSCIFDGTLLSPAIQTELETGASIAGFNVQ